MIKDLETTPPPCNPMDFHRTLCQAVEERDLRRCVSSFLLAACGMYASFLRIRAPCISSFFISLPTMLFINGYCGNISTHQAPRSSGILKHQILL